MAKLLVRPTSGRTRQTHFDCDVVAGADRDDAIELRGGDAAAAANDGVVSIVGVGLSTNIGIALTPKGSGQVALTGGLVISSGGLGITSGGLTVTAGGIAVTAGDLVTTAGDRYLVAAASKDVQGGTAEGAALTYVRKIISKAGIVENTATDILTVTVPNVSTKAMIRILVMASLDSAPINDSARVVEYNVIVARKAGAEPVAAISAAVGAQITTPGSVTLTTTLTLGAMTSNGVTATETFTVKVTNDASAGSPTSSIVAVVEVVNETTGGVTTAAA